MTNTESDCSMVFSELKAQRHFSYYET